MQVFWLCGCFFPPLVEHPMVEFFPDLCMATSTNVKEKLLLWVYDEDANAEKWVSDLPPSELSVTLKSYLLVMTWKESNKMQTLLESFSSFFKCIADLLPEKCLQLTICNLLSVISIYKLFFFYQCLAIIWREVQFIFVYWFQWMPLVCVNVVFLSGFWIFPMLLGKDFLGYLLFGPTMPLG